MYYGKRLIILGIFVLIASAVPATAQDVVWQYPASMPWDAERLLNNNTLITEFGNHTVVEVTPAGEIVWQYGDGTAGSGANQLNCPVDAERLDNGNTLITDRNNHRVIEVNSTGDIVWQYGNGTPGSGPDQLNYPMDAEQLDSGNVLITDEQNSRVIEVAYPNKQIVWEINATTTGLYFPKDADRLLNGNTLVADYRNHRVVEVNQTGEIVWQYGNGTAGAGVNQLWYPTDVERLPDGNTLIVDHSNHRVIEVRTSDYDAGKPNNNFTAESIVWQYGTTGVSGSGANELHHPTDAERLYNGNVLIADKDNNRVIEILIAPDLLTTALLTPPTLYANLSSTISATIKNNGTGDASSFNVSLSADALVVDKVEVSGLGAGESTAVSLSWTPPRTGDFELCVAPDCDFEVNESNEDNNVLCKNVTVFSFEHPCWTDSFDDETKIAVMQKVVVSDGDVKIDLETVSWLWRSDSSASGLPINYSSWGEPAYCYTPAVAFNITGDGRWNLIAGNSSGEFHGFYWNDSLGQWISEPALVAGLEDAGSYPTPAIAFNITGDGRWNLIAGNSSGEFHGFYWNDSLGQWISDSSLVAGLGDVGDYSAPAIAFNITGDGRWNLISGEFGGGFHGFYWDDSLEQWVNDSSLVAGLGDIGDRSSPAIAFNITGDGRWNLISGDRYGKFYGFYWDDSLEQWISDSSLVAGLGVKDESSPTIAFNITGDGRWDLVSGEWEGGFYGFRGGYIGRIKSVVIQSPLHLAARFYANDTVPAGTSIIYKILDEANNTIMSIEDGQIISGIAGESFRLFAELLTVNPSCTPVLHDWGVCWEAEEVDLLPTAIETPPELYSNLSFTIDAEIANDGTINSGGFNVSLYADETEVDKKVVDDIPAEDSITVTFKWTPIHVGYYNLTVIADCDGAIVESNETNNVLTKEEVVVLPTNIRRVTFDLNSSRKPSIATDSDGNIHIVWQDYRSSTDPNWPNWEIFYKKLAPNGSVLVNDTRLTYTSRSCFDGWNYRSFGASIDPAVAVDPTGNVFVAWMEQETDCYSPDFHIYFTKLDDSGNVLIAPRNLTPTNMEGYLHESSALGGFALDSAGVIHVLWEQYTTRYATKIHKVYYGQFDNNGNPIGDPIYIGGLSTKGYGSFEGVRGDRYLPSTAFALDSGNNVHVVYNAPYKEITCTPGGWGKPCHYDPECPYPDCVQEIYYRKIDSGGTVHDVIRLTDDNRTFASLRPNVCVDADDNVHVVWINNEVMYDPEYQHDPECQPEPGGYFDNHSYDLFYTKLDNNGNTVVDDKRITFDRSPEPIAKPSIDTESGIIYIAWSEKQPASREVYYTALGTSGGILMNTTLISLNDGFDSWEPGLAACKVGAHVVWTDSRDGNNEIYYAKTTPPRNRVFLLCPPGKWTPMNVNATYAIGIMSTMNNTETFDLTLDNLDGADVAELSTYTVTVDPDSTVEVTLNVTDAVIGDYRVKVSVESRTNPAINASAIITTSVVEPEPDLIITAIDAYHNDTGYPPYFNLSNEVDVEVKNVGTEDAGAFNVSLYADGEFVDRQNVPELGMGNSTLVQFKWTPAGIDCEDGGTSLTYTLKAIADCDNDVNESDEENNETTVEEITYWAGYSADEHINAVAWHGTLRGSLNYTTGDGVYSTLYNPGDSATTHYDITLPAGAVVKLARLNVYYTWSKADYPVMEVSITNATGTYVVPLAASYNDRPCPSPAIGYEYPFGNYVYDLTPYIQGSGTYTVTVKNAGPGGCSFCIAAPGLVILYEDDTEPEREFWILEGADVLEGGRRGGAGNLALEECICNATFTGDVDTGKVGTATLGIVSPWGGAAWGAYTSHYWFNDHYLGNASILGGYDSLYDKTVDGITMHVGASNNAQVGANVSDVTSYIINENNTVSFGDDGDSMMAANAFLVVEYEHKPPAPFFVYGWVNASDGAPVVNPGVTITNLNTSEVFIAETIPDSSFYQVLTSSWNVSAGDVLHFVNHLLREGHIDSVTFGALVIQHQIEITQLPDLTLRPGDLVELPEDAAFQQALGTIQHGHEVLGRVGKGSMAEVCVALEQDLRRRVALKRLHQHMASQPGVMARFFREAQVTAQLEHPNIVPVYRLDTENEGQLTYTMKLIQGRTLRTYLKETRAFHDRKEPVDDEHLLPTRLRHLLKICDAVAYAHGKGVVHRDLKPTNIMIGPYHEVYLMDWGIARLVRECADSADDLLQLAELDTDLAVEETQFGVIIGTPSYMSPEQASGDSSQVGPLSDQYALGLILFELVTLQRAIPGGDAETLVANAQAGHKRALQHYQPSIAIPRELRAIIQQATAPDPAARYPNVEALSDDILRYLDGESVTAQPDTPLQGLSRWLARHRDTSLALMAGLLFLVLLTIIGFLFQNQQVRERARQREQALGQVLTAVAGQSHRIDAHFLKYEGLLHGLAAAANQALSVEHPPPSTLYLDTDFQHPQTAPPDLAFSPRYHMPISVDWPVVKLAPGVHLETAQPILDRLATLRAHFRRMMLRSQGDDNTRLDPQAAHKLILEDGVPLVWAYVAVQEGIHEAYPGKAGYPTDYDPRTRPWYRLAAGKHGPQWGNPYPDTLGQGLILPCAMSLYDDDGAFQGVAGVELTFDYVIDHLLDLPDQQGVTETYLLDERGDIVIRTQTTATKSGRFYRLVDVPAEEEVRAGHDDPQGEESR